jgi:effector-binding domain-containing protein
VKKIFVAIAIIILLILIGGYAFLIARPCDYQAHFTIKAAPDIVYYNILNWDTWNRKQESSKIEIVSKTPVSNLSKKVILKDTTLIFNWVFNKMNDSVTMVRVYVSDTDRKLYNRLTVPFINTPFKKSVRSNLLDIKTRLELMLKKFHYDFTGYVRFDKKTCVCINITSTPAGKARAMMSTVVELNQFVRQNNLKMNGNPFLVVYDWDEAKDTINYDFCFPISDTDFIPAHPDIKLKKIDSMDALKTDFFGNYSITDITWYSLSEEVKKAGYRSNNKLIEVYFNDPHSGGNELEWKAEIYMGVESVN